MAWPSDQDYNEAIQNPRIAFADPELQIGQVEVNLVGLPKARSGNFAAVYKIVSKGAAYAIRCFRYENPEHNIRYPAIASHLNRDSLPYMVSFRCLSQGIRVGSRWYPILKMKWIDGDTLVSYVEKHLSSAKALENLAADWIRMVECLQRSGIAHGDLQHGNVIVAQGAIKLVDYDGMYVPALAGSLGIELGHRNYQHPERTELDFGPYLDSFSAWLIYVSLVALAARPALWKELRGGDECLLFRRDDLVAPDRSEAFRLLRAVPAKSVQGLVAKLESFLWLPLDDIPALSGGRAERLREGERREEPPVHEDADALAVPGGAFGGSAWIRDHVGPTVVPQSFENRVQVDRVLGLAVSCAAVLLCHWLVEGTAIGGVPLAWPTGFVGAALLSVPLWMVRYAREPACGRIRAIRAEYAEALGHAKEARGRLEEALAAWQERNDSYSAERSKLRSQQRALPAAEARDLKAIEANEAPGLEQISASRRTVAAEEGNEKRRLADTVGAKIARLGHQLASLPNHERNEITGIESSVGAAVRSLENQLQVAQAHKDAELRQALKYYQDEIVNGHLHRHRISEASIPGIGPECKRRLAVAGYFSAGDVGTRRVRVPGIGVKKWDALVAWRRNLEGPIRAREVPTSLPSYKRASVEQPHDSRIRQLHQSLASERSRLESAIDGVRAKYQAQRDRLEQERATEEANLRQQLAALEQRFRNARAQLGSEETQRRSKWDQAATECRNKYRKIAAELTQQIDQVTGKYRADVANLMAEYELATKLWRQRDWQREAVAGKLSAWAVLSFRRYLSRVFGF